MSEHVSRFSSALYDQQNEDPVADWGGDDLFTRMPRPRAVDDAPAPRFQPSLALVDASAARDVSAARDAAGAWDAAAWRAATEPGSDPAPAPEWHPTVRQWDGSSELAERAPNGRRTTVITGRPDGAPRPLSFAPADSRRPARTPAERVGPRPERIMAWAFVLGLLLIMIAISTADAATL
jgi:hypothetical protein